MGQMSEQEQANSNYAKQQVIKGKIEVYEDLKYSLSAENWNDMIDKIRILESELKQLETSKI